MSSIKLKNPIKILLEIEVTDIDRAIKFYETIFNFSVSEDSDLKNEIVFLELPGTTTRLSLIKKDEEITPGSSYIAFFVENLSETQKFLEKQGFLTSDIYHIPNGFSEFYFLDSEGNKIGIKSE